VCVQRPGFAVGEPAERLQCGADPTGAAVISSTRRACRSRIRSNAPSHRARGRRKRRAAEKRKIMEAAVDLAREPGARLIDFGAVVRSPLTFAHATPRFALRSSG
jgi:hypothetical protein